MSIRFFEFLFVFVLSVIYLFHFWLGVVSLMQFDLLRREEHDRFSPGWRHMMVLALFNFIVALMVFCSPSTRRRVLRILHACGCYNGDFSFAINFSISQVLDVFVPHALIRIPLLFAQHPNDDWETVRQVELVNFYISCGFLSLPILWRIVWAYYMNFFETESK